MSATLPLGLEPAALPADAIEVGRIADAWGIKGWFKVIPYSAEPQALFSSKRWFLQPPERGPHAFSGVALLAIREAKEHADAVVASAHGVDDRSAADGLRGARIFIARSSFPTPAADEYYWVDLIGLAVFNRAGEALGTVCNLLATGPQTVLVLAYHDAQGRACERLIPFVAAYIDAVDMPARCIRVDWQTDY